MATVYSPEYKASIIERMLPPNNVSVPELVGETGIPKDTLYSWRSRAREQGLEAAQASEALERELRRKDKALAEAAALLVLDKKLQTLLGADAGEGSAWSSDAP